MRSRYRLYVSVFCLVLGLAPCTALARPYVDPAPRCFVETDQCVQGRFLQYWEENGGMAVFGLPITSARPERNPDTGQFYLTQWFERNRFEYHPDNAAPDDVLLGRLGAERLEQLGVDWRTLPHSPRPAAAECLEFHVAGTDRWVCDQEPGTGFATYWRTHGLSDPRLSSYAQSLALFGLPLTGPRMETNSSGDRVLTQWFERARFEWHAGNPRAFKVLLGRLGPEVQQAGHQAGLKYFWPTWIPRGLVVQPDQSSATDEMFRLQLAEPHGGQFDATIRGGRGSEAPRSVRGESVTVRGRTGLAITTGAGYSVYWVEDGQPYAIVSGLGLRDVLQLAEGLEGLDLATWRATLGGTR